MGVTDERERWILTHFFFYQGDPNYADRSVIEGALSSALRRNSGQAGYHLATQAGKGIRTMNHEDTGQ